MKISLNWLKKYVDIKVPDDELVRLIGARLVEVEGVIDETHKYDNIYIVRVESCEHIDGTHLSLCKINTGGVKVPKVEDDEDGLVQVMCGAPNVRAGMLAVWIAPGAVVPASVHEDAPFVIGKRKMLSKYDSYGMLAGADELDFATEHKTIVEIDPEMAKPGDSLADVFDLKDLILDIENKSLTHRPDCFGLLGFAREVAGILGEEWDASQNTLALAESARAFKNGKVDGRLSAGFENAPSITIDDAAICARYTAIVLKKHGELKKKYLTWQDTILMKSGMRPIDPIVDATNYLMLLTGQPLHAFDYDKFIKVGRVRDPKVVVRLARDGEKLELLDGKEVTLLSNDIVIASNDVPVALAGAMGGASTEIDENTRTVMIEAATFSLYNLRKTQMEHGIFSEAITRFTKGQPAYQTLAVGMACAELLQDGFKVAAVVDEYPEPTDEIKVKISLDEINGLLGTNYDETLVVQTLTNVGFVVKKSRKGFEIKVPEWRTDIHIKEDVIEEVGRLLGYDNITPVLPRHRTADRNPELQFKARTREIMRSYGANEVLTYSFVSGRLLEKAGLIATNSYKIVNSISPELQYVRQSIVPSLLEKAYMNQKIPFDKFALFEINKVYQKEWGMNDEKVPVEKMRLGLVLAERKGVGTAYYKARKFVETYLSENNIVAEFRSLSASKKVAEAVPFEPKRAAEIVANGECLGYVGEFKNSAKRNFKLTDFVAGAELDLEKVQAKVQRKKLPESFVVKEKLDETVTTTETYAKVYAKMLAKYPGAKITPVGIYQPEDKETKNITFHIELL